MSGKLTTTPAASNARAAPPKTFHTVPFDFFLGAKSEMFIIFVSLIKNLYGHALAVFADQARNQRLDHRDRLFDGGLDRSRQAHALFAFGHRLRLAADQHDALKLAAHALDHAEHLQRIHRMSFNHHRLRVQLVERAEIRLDGVERARRAATRRRVNEDRRFITVEQRVRQIEAAYTEVNQPHSVRQPPRAEPP